MIVLITLFIVGLIAGILSGFFGIGGGVIIVPALVFFLGFSQKLSNGISLSALLLPVSIFAVIKYSKSDFVDIKIAALIAVGIFMGVYGGANIAVSMPSILLKQIYGVFLLYTAFKYLYSKKNNFNEINSHGHKLNFIALFIGIFAGILSGLFGIGGGAVIVPALVGIMKFSPKKAAGTSLGALLLPVGLPGVIKYYSAGFFDIRLASFVAIGIIIGAYFGAHIAIKLPSKLTKKIFGIFLFIIGLDFIITGFIH
jgi:uncharacterized membrane protein YfcA